MWETTQLHLFNKEVSLKIDVINLPAHVTLQKHLISFNERKILLKTAIIDFILRIFCKVGSAYFWNIHFYVNLTIVFTFRYKTKCFKIFNLQFSNSSKIHHFTINSIYMLLFIMSTTATNYDALIQKGANKTLQFCHWDSIRSE